MALRFRLGHKLMKADRSHLHYTLIDRGLGQRQTLLLLLCYASLCAAMGIALEGTWEYLSLLCYFLLFCGHCLFVIKSAALGGRRMTRSLSKL